MPLTYDQITAITEKKFIPKLVDNIFNKSEMLKRLKAKEKPQPGGETVMVPLNYAQVSASGWYQGSETLDTADNEVITAFNFDWKQLYANISITRRDELRNSGDAAIIDFVKSKVEIAEKTIGDQLATGLFSAGTNAKSILGSRVFIATSGTYGGISLSSYSWAQGQVDSTTTTLTIAAMENMYGNCGNGDDYPDLIVGDQDMYDRYFGLLQPQQRFQDEEMAKGGFKNLMFNAAPFVADSHSPAGYLQFFNMDYLDLYPHKDENFRMEPFAKPINQNVKVGKIYWMGVLASSNNRRHGAMTAITA